MTIGDKFVLNVLSVLFITNTDCSDGHELFKKKILKTFRVDKFLTLNYRELYVNFRPWISITKTCKTFKTFLFWVFWVFWVFCSLINKTCKTDKTFFFVLSVLGVLFITTTDRADWHGFFVVVNKNIKEPLRVMLAL